MRSFLITAIALAATTSMRDAAPPPPPIPSPNVSVPSADLPKVAIPIAPEIKADDPQVSPDCTTGACPLPGTPVAYVSAGPSKQIPFAGPPIPTKQTPPVGMPPPPSKQTPPVGLPPIPTKTPPPQYGTPQAYYATPQYGTPQSYDAPPAGGGGCKLFGRKRGGGLIARILHPRRA